MKRLPCIAILLSAILPLWAQGDLLEYRWDIGGGPALVMPVTDGVEFMQSVNMGFGLVARRNFNPRMSLRTNLSWLHASGNTKATYMPADPSSMTPEGGQYAWRSWSRNMIDAACVGELNFWGYGDGPTYKGNKRITPYILAGVGLTVALAPQKANVAMNIPVGVGVKYKIANRLNAGLEWRFSFTTTDKLDADGGQYPTLDDPYGIPSEGMKNKDQYSTLMLTLTYDISPKYRKCNN